jgi:tripartite-type tricarboxylate transporter receptor subunit TctC
VSRSYHRSQNREERVPEHPEEKIVKKSVLLLLAVSLMVSATAGAQTYPAKPIRLVVPYDPGGPTDTLARAASQKAAEGLGGSIVLDFKPGASTMIGADIVAKSAPDGYTLLLTTAAAVAVNQHLFSKLAYNPEKDLTGVVRLATNPYGIFANPSVPANSLKELLAYAKANPGKLNVGLPGENTPTHFALKQLEFASGTQFTAVQYKGNAQALTDVLGGRIELMLSSPVIMLPHVKSGKLKVLVMTAAKRVPYLPDTPVVAETYPGFEAATWFGVVAPAGTPRPILTRLNTEFNKLMTDTAARERLQGLGMILDGGTVDEMNAYIKRETETWGALIKRMGIKPE